MTPPLRLNHLYRVVDAETCAAARASSWLHELFAPSEVRTTHRPDWAYTGLYCYGTHTYLELFEEGAQGPVGASGLAFALDEAGSTAALADRWRSTLGDADHRLVVRPTGDEMVPWFHIAHAIPDRRGNLKLWSMEYEADFLSTWHPDGTDDRGITRAAVLRRYAALVDGPPSPLLGDVVAVRLALAPTERGFLERHLEAFDAHTRVVGDDASLTEGDDISIGVSPATTDRHGVQEVVCRLRRAAGRETITIGRITIEVDGTRAVWKFR